VNGRIGGDIFYSFLNKIFDRQENEIENILPRYISDLWRSKKLGKQGIQEGLQKFLNIVPDIAPDYPKLGQYLAKVLKVLYDE